jgi:hypothetical protein
MDLKRKLIHVGREYTCEQCNNNGNWCGASLALHVHHIDGNRKNNELNNISFLCPNCHSQTDSFAGRNVNSENRNVWKLVDEQTWIIALQKYGTISGAINFVKLNHRNGSIRKHVKSVADKHDIHLKSKPTLLNQDVVNRLFNSNIDFQKFGWVNDASKIIGITPQKVGLWMQKNVHDFYFHQCYRRKLVSK